MMQLLATEGNIPVSTPKLYHHLRHLLFNTIGYVVHYYSTFHQPLDDTAVSHRKHYTTTPGICCICQPPIALHHQIIQLLATKGNILVSTFKPHHLLSHLLFNTVGYLVHYYSTFHKSPKAFHPKMMKLLATEGIIPVSTHTLYHHPPGI